MKYFKHLTSGRKGNRLQEVYDKLGFHKGYALYFMLMEHCAEQYDGESHDFKIPWRSLEASLFTNRRTVSQLIQLLSSNDLLHCVENDMRRSFVHFRWPELAEIADEYTQKVRRMSGKSPSQIKIKNKNKIKKENKNKIKKDTSPQTPQKNSLPFLVFEAYNRICSEKLPKAKVLSPQRIQAIKKLQKDFKEFSKVEHFESYFTHVASVDFLCGGGSGDWKADFDWLLKPTNAIKVAEGRYDNLNFSNGSAKKQDQHIRTQWERVQRGEL